MAMAQDHAQAQGGQPVLRQREQRAPFAGLPSYQPTRDQEQDRFGKRMEVVYHCITTNPAYRAKSFEELRLEYYKHGNKGCGGALASVPPGLVQNPAFPSAGQGPRGEAGLSSTGPRRILR